MHIFFQIFKTPLLYAFGASDNVIKYAHDYIGLYLYGTIFGMLSLGLNTFISGQGNAKVAMLSVLIGAVTNIILDPIFIFVLGMVIFGIQQAIQGTFLALGQAKYSIFIALLRKVILLVPLAVILPIFMGVKGIYYAEPIADITSVSIASITFLLTYKKILKSRGMKK